MVQFFIHYFALITLNPLNSKISSVSPLSFLSAKIVPTIASNCPTGIIFDGSSSKPYSHLRTDCKNLQSAEERSL